MAGPSMLGLMSRAPSAGGREAEPRGEGPDTEPDPAEDALRVASDGVFDALSTGDRAGFSKALSSFVRIAGLTGGDGEEEMGEG